jgi:hypothetical protein
LRMRPASPGRSELASQVASWARPNRATSGRRDGTAGTRVVSRNKFRRLVTFQGCAALYRRGARAPGYRGLTPRRTRCPRRGHGCRRPERRRPSSPEPPGRGHSAPSRTVNSPSRRSSMASINTLRSGHDLTRGRNRPLDGSLRRVGSPALSLTRLVTVSDARSHADRTVGSRDSGINGSRPS